MAGTTLPATPPDPIRLFRAVSSQRRRILLAAGVFWLALGLLLILAAFAGQTGAVNSDQIAFVGGIYGDTDIYLLDINSGLVENLTNDFHDDAHPAWSPDGRWIAYMSNRNGSNNLYVMDSIGRQEWQLTTSRYYDGYPAWAPDGRTIAFISTRAGSREIYLLSIDAEHQLSGDARVLTASTADSWQPAWAPDGAQILYLNKPPGEDYIKIYVIDAACAGNAQAAGDCHGPRPLTDWTLSDSEPVFSPDGQWIAFTGMLDAGQSDIFVLAAGCIVTAQPCDDQPIRLTDSPVNEVRPVWAPDSGSLLFGSNQDGNWEIYRVYLPDGQQAARTARLTNHPGFDGEPLWTPDGQAIVFRSSRGSMFSSNQSDFFIMDLQGGEAHPLGHSNADYLLTGMARWRPRAG